MTANPLRILAGVSSRRRGMPRCRNAGRLRLRNYLVCQFMNYGRISNLNYAIA
jgi:hypothetical protein